MEDRPILIKADTTKIVTAGTSTAAVTLPTGGGRNVMLANRGSADIFFNFGPSTITVAIPSGATQGGACIPPGAVYTCTPPEGATHIATISGSASQTLYVTAGTGG